MSQLILAVHPGGHGAAAAVYDDYKLLAAVQLERLTRQKGDGREHPDLAIDEVLSIAGAARKDVDVATFSRTEFPTEFYRTIRGVRWLPEKYRKYVEKRTRRYMPPEFQRYKTMRIDDIVNIPKFRRASGFAMTRKCLSIIITKRTLWPRCFIRSGKTRSWSPRMPAAIPSITAIGIWSRVP